MTIQNPPTAMTIPPIAPIAPLNTQQQMNPMQIQYAQVPMNVQSTQSGSSGLVKYPDGTVGFSFIMDHEETGEYQFYLDTCCSQHIVNDLSLLRDAVPDTSFVFGTGSKSAELRSAYRGTLVLRPTGLVS